MGGICEYCVGGYWECGEGPRCVDPGKTHEDRCHKLKIIGRKTQAGCLRARLFVGPDSKIPAGWKKWNVVPIQVQTFYAGPKPTARVYVPEPECNHQTCLDWKNIQISPEDVAELDIPYQSDEKEWIAGSAATDVATDADAT